MFCSGTAGVTGVVVFVPEVVSLLFAQADKTSANTRKRKLFLVKKNFMVLCLIVLLRVKARDYKRLFFQINPIHMSKTVLNNL